MGVSNGPTFCGLEGECSWAFWLKGHWHHANPAASSKNMKGSLPSLFTGRASFHPGKVSSHQKDSCSHGSGVIMLYWQHSLTILHSFKKLLIPTTFAFKSSRHPCRPGCGDSSSWNSDFLSSMLSPEVLYVVGVFSFAPQDGEGFLFAKYKRKALWYYQALEKSQVFLWKPKVVPKRLLWKKKVTYET